jgi:glycosyltransferase involved in cell wall biosynthesis
MLRISIVMPYFNEASSLQKTFELLEAQTLRPAEIVFVDSGSTDNSRALINQWRNHRNNIEPQVLIKNVPAMTGVPSSSKNVGVDYSTSEFVAFMDCGIIFPATWLQEQAKFLKDSGVDVVSGFGVFQGKGWLDRCAIAQTYGYLRPRPTVPTTVVRRDTFEASGRFLENRRAGYDVDWIDQLKARNIERGLNPKVTIQYNGINFTSGFRHLFRKVVTYAEPCVAMSNYSYPYWYASLAFLALVLLGVSPSLFLSLVGVYFVGRGYLIPLWKSRNAQILFDEPFSIIGLPLVGAVMDSAKLLGYLRGIKRFHLAAGKLRANQK